MPKNNSTEQKKIYRCAACGKILDFAHFDLNHIRPLNQELKQIPKNLTILCEDCHNNFGSQPREIEFVNFLTSLLKGHPLFSNVEQEVIIGDGERLRPDILVQRNTSDGYEVLVIECKTAAVLSTLKISSVVDQLKTYAAHLPGARPVLAVPASLSEQQRRFLSDASVEVWDLSALAELFGEQVSEIDLGFYGRLLREHIFRAQRRTREEELMSRLIACEPGMRDWHLYQSLVGEILEHLFYPPLSKPIPELFDKLKVNRRDFIIPNYADSGFWFFLRAKYQADYIVVDAKNYSAKVEKADVLQIANYLKSHGAGLFGLICSRKGGDEKGCEYTLREQWLVHQKMIIILNDEDVLAMLTAKSERRGPEEVLANKIQSFRLSM
jgi:DNA-directed RNA polymerase subunit RPC12/RpoP